MVWVVSDGCGRGQPDRQEELTFRAWQVYTKFKQEIMLVQNAIENMKGRKKEDALCCIQRIAKSTAQLSLGKSRRLV